MGAWFEVVTIYGPVEEWEPEFAGDWPDDKTVPVPPPCPECGGKVTRRIRTNERAVLGDVQTRALQRWRWGIQGPEPLPEPIVRGWRYEIRHYTHDARPHEAPAPTLFAQARRVGDE